MKNCEATNNLIKIASSDTKVKNLFLCVALFAHSVLDKDNISDNISSMINKLFSVFDKVSSDFAPPFVAKNANVARRFLESSFKRTPELNRNDFELYEMGSFDSETGKIDCLEKPVVAVESSEVLE